MPPLIGASLREPLIQQIYVDHVFNIYINFDKSNLRLRQAQFQAAILIVADTVGLPHPSFRWCADDRAAFDYRLWRMNLGLHMLAFSPHRRFHQWLLWATDGYHELRHLEQFYSMAQVMLLGKIPIPGYPNLQVLPPQDTLDNRKNALEWVHKYPREILARADATKHRFSKHGLRDLRALVRQVFGEDRAQRKVTLLNQDGSMKHYVRYLDLLDEKDAWARQREVKRRLRECISRSANELAYQGIEPLFRD